MFTHGALLFLCTVGLPGEFVDFVYVCAVFVVFSVKKNSSL